MTGRPSTMTRMPGTPSMTAGALVLMVAITFGPPPGPGELLAGAKPHEGGRPGRAHRVQHLGGRHEFLVDQGSGGNVLGRIALG